MVCVPQTSMKVRPGRASERSSAASRPRSSAVVIAVVVALVLTGLVEPTYLPQKIDGLLGLGLLEDADGEAGVHQDVVAHAGVRHQHDAALLFQARGGDRRLGAVDGGDAHGKGEAHVEVLSRSRSG